MIDAKMNLEPLACQPRRCAHYASYSKQEVQTTIGVNDGAGAPPDRVQGRELYRDETYVNRSEPRLEVCHDLFARCDFAAREYKPRRRVRPKQEESLSTQAVCTYVTLGQQT